MRGRGVAVLCCPEAVVGGLADYVADPRQIVVTPSEMLTRLSPVADARSTTIVGFTELASDGCLQLSGGRQPRDPGGCVSKGHPAIRQSVYRAGEDSPVFNSDGFYFGVLLRYDSTFPDLDVDLVSRGARVLVPTNNALPESKSPSATPLVRPIKNAAAVITELSDSDFSHALGVSPVRRPNNAHRATPRRTPTGRFKNYVETV